MTDTDAEQEAKKILKSLGILKLEVIAPTILWIQYSSESADNATKAKQIATSIERILPADDWRVVVSDESIELWHEPTDKELFAVMRKVARSISIQDGMEILRGFFTLIKKQKPKE